MECFLFDVANIKWKMYICDDGRKNSISNERFFGGTCKVHKNTNTIGVLGKNGVFRGSMRCI